MKDAEVATPGDGADFRHEVSGVTSAAPGQLDVSTGDKGLQRGWWGRWAEQNDIEAHSGTEPERIAHGSKPLQVFRVK
jgi:hypothetical protein